jgi:hypothetical protein
LSTRVRLGSQAGKLGWDWGPSPYSTFCPYLPWEFFSLFSYRCARIDILNPVPSIPAVHLCLSNCVLSSEGLQNHLYNSVEQSALRCELSTRLSRRFVPFREYKNSSPVLKEPTSSSDAEPDKSSPHPRIFFSLRYILITISYQCPGRLN